jgi:hypothetical protein
MPTIATGKRVNHVTVDKKIKDHSEDPFVVKKLESAKKLINKYGLPRRLKIG